MASYTITIRTDGADAETTVRVDDSGMTPRVTEVSVRATSDKGLAAPQPPVIDPGLLLRALRGIGAPSSSEATAEPAAAQGRKPTPRATRRMRTATQTVASKATKTRTRRSPTAEGSRRNYRRMPDDLAATFAKVGGVTAVANHYGVPRHTAQGWIARLRRQG